MTNIYTCALGRGYELPVATQCPSLLFVLSDDTQKRTVPQALAHLLGYLEQKFDTDITTSSNYTEVMIQDEIQNFASDAPEMLPELLDASSLKTSFLSDEFAVLTYCYDCGFKMEEILNMLKDQMAVILLYDARVSESTSYGWSCCAYSNPMFGQMFKINSKTNGCGLVMELAVTLYESMEFMSQDVMSDYYDCKEKNPTGYFRSMLDVIGDLF